MIVRQNNSIQLIGMYEMNGILLRDYFVLKLVVGFSLTLANPFGVIFRFIY